MAKKKLQEDHVDSISTDEQLMKVNFCIPPLGAKIVLAEPWSFDLYWEGRNDKFIDSLDLREPETSSRWLRSEHVWKLDSGVCKNPTYREVLKKLTLPRGAKLTVSRIYIRNGVSDYDSVTFILNKPKVKKGQPSPPWGRFWAKLHDVNRIVCYPIGSDPEVNALWNKPETKHLRQFRFLDINDPLD